MERRIVCPNVPESVRHHGSIRIPTAPGDPDVRPFPTTAQPLAGNVEDPALIYTRQLLSEIAFQLRMLRRRAVIPTLASLGTFLVAYISSVVLSFANVAPSGSVDQLGLGLLYTWLPVLVIFTIVDRNPVSGGCARYVHNPSHQANYQC